VDLETLIVTVYCVVDEALVTVLDGRRLRQRGPMPRLADSEVLTIEIVGEVLRLDHDAALFAHFRRYHADLFPALARIHRTTFVRQAANLWSVKERIWHLVLARIPHDPHVSLVDSFPLPVCRFARAPRCRRFRGTATFGYDALAHQHFYGFRCHVRCVRPGVIATLSLAPAHEADRTLLPELVAGVTGFVVGDRGYWSPALAAQLRAQGAVLLASYRSATYDPHPARSQALSRIRRRIETIFGQLVEHFAIKRVWARDLWHLQSRLHRKVLSHTIASFLTGALGYPPLQHARLLT
jgi:hypothetical protein